MTERHSLIIKEAPGLHEDWTTLIARAADDVSRIVQSEIHLFESSFRSALEGQIKNALAGLVLVALMICGTLCALAALLLYAHQWMQWWQACALGAFIMVAAAGVIRATVFAAPSKRTDSLRPGAEAVALDQAAADRTGKL